MTRDEALAELRRLKRVRWLKALAELRRLKRVEAGQEPGERVEAGQEPGDRFNDDTEAVHCAADDVLLDLIADPEIRFAFEDIPKWYS